MKKQELIQLIKECHSEILKENKYSNKVNMMHGQLNALIDNVYNEQDLEPADEKALNSIKSALNTLMIKLSGTINKIAVK